MYQRSTIDTHQLRDEAKRRSPREEVVSKLMEITFAHRRENILGSRTDISDLLKEYPFLAHTHTLAHYDH